MKDMVWQVVEALRRNPFMDHNRVMRSAIRKRNVARLGKIRRPAKTTGERDRFDKERERERKNT